MKEGHFHEQDMEKVDCMHYSSSNTCLKCWFFKCKCNYANNYT